MPAMRVCQLLSAAILRRAFRAGEPPDESERKQLILPLLAVLLVIAWVCCAYTVYVIFDVVNNRGVRRPLYIGYIGIWLNTLSCTVFFAGVLATRSLPKWALELLICGPVMLCVVCSDWGYGMLGNAEVWSYGVLLMDCLLLTGARPAPTAACLAALVVWLVVRSIEDCFRLGLWDVPFSDFTMLVLNRILPFVCDFWWTRRFAMGQQTARRELRDAVATELAALRFDPGHLRAACSFLPDGVVRQQKEGGSEASSQTPFGRGSRSQSDTALCSAASDAAVPYVTWRPPAVDGPPPAALLEAAASAALATIFAAVGGGMLLRFDATSC
eukprot:gene15347-38980_t